MPDPLIVAFVPGVTPGKWERTWRERRPRGRLELRPHTQAEALAALEGGTGAEAIELVAANVGVAVLPQSVARAHSRKDVVARPLSGAPDTGIALVWPTRDAHPLCDEFIGIVRGRTANSSR